MTTRNWRLRFQVHNVLAASALGLVLQAPLAMAQTAPADTATTTELDTVVVTGSYIRGTPEDAALPVDVISAADLEEQGSPTVVQLVKSITASQSSIGESNRYNGGAGTASINLRGFGASRTLTLFNGRRMADSPLAAFQGGGANLNFIPQAAVGRVEILKDGAAATYGSDAVAGVVNFITRTDLDGLELAAEFSEIKGSDGDYEGSIAWGKKMGGGNVLATFGYRHRSRLDIHERDWALQPFESPFWGGWTGAGNPGTYVGNVASAAAPSLFTDNGCAQLGGTFFPSPTCRFQFSAFNDIVNEEDHYQAHIEFNAEIGDSVKAHTEVTWARDFVPMQRLSPANTNTQFPTPVSLGGTSGSLAPVGLNNAVRYNVPWYNPGLQDLAATCATAPVLFIGTNNCATLTTVTAAGGPGVDVSTTAWRAIAMAGHPTNPDKADHQVIDNKAFRVSSSLKGDIGSIGWETAATFMSAHSAVNTNDLLVNRIQQGLNGFLSMPGSSDPCSDADIAALRALGAADNFNQHVSRGCFFYNPFTNAYPVSASNGATNPFYRGAANPNVINQPLVVESMYGNYTNDFTNSIFVFDVVFNGELPFLELPGGKTGWALGGQYRYTDDKNEYGDLFNNEVNPCVDSITRTGPRCDAPNGPLEFFGSNNNSENVRSVYSAFGELSLPITDSFNASVAARYEAYPGNIGSTFDPKLSLRWQALDWIALRGSVGTTFRAPTAAQVNPGCTTGVANINGTYRAVETCGNPDLEPETADTYNVGILLNPGNFTASIDYWSFKFQKELTAESAARLYTAMFPSPTAAPLGNCGVAAYAPLQARFGFAGNVCSAANVLRIQTYTVNGPTTDTSGIDFRAEYRWPELLGGALNVGVEATYLLEYARGALQLKGAPTIIASPAEDRAGTNDLGTQFYSYPELKGNLFVAFKISDFTFRVQSLYSGPTDVAPGLGYTGHVDAFIQHDLIVRWNGPSDLVVGANVLNVLDTDPPDAAGMFNYDYTGHNPLGRVFELNVKKKF
jgi:iron complex outermembrane receptor protein